MTRRTPARATLRRTAAGWRLALGLAASVLVPAVATAQDKTLIMASTTSTEQSGLFAHLLPEFKKVTGIPVKVVAQGTGQALDMGRRGDADVLFVHDQAAEEKFVADGWGLERRAVMYNDFVIVGPKSDPAGIRGRDVAAALKRIAAGNAGFISRGDKSGTHAAEQRYWKLAGIDTLPARGTGYKACGCGMGPALNIAASADAYAMTDRGTWLSFKNRAGLGVLVEGDQRLFNPYGVIVVNPARHPHVKQALAQAFADWVLSPAGQSAIARFKVGGEPLFFPSTVPK